MATPRDVILDYIATQLATMGTGQYQQVPQVLRHKHTAHALSQLPSVVITATSEEYAWHGLTGVYARTLNIGIWYVFASETQDDDAAKIIVDVETVLADYTLGGNANDFTFISNTFHAGDADEPLAIIEFNCRASYRTSVAAPNTRV